MLIWPFSSTEQTKKEEKRRIYPNVNAIHSRKRVSSEKIDYLQKKNFLS
jgi:hypothetical protein